MVPGGEVIRSALAFVDRKQRSLFENHIDRHFRVLAVWGGAVLDAVGLAVATTHRGVRHVRVAPAVLSPDDSVIGVKNGVSSSDR